MASYDPRDDVPEADRVEQERDVVPDLDDDAPDFPEMEVDPLKADEADQIDQALTVPEDDDYDDR
jgi:hypothetical protein